MRFSDIIFGQINEENINKNLINQLLKKWSSENQNLTFEDVQKIVYEDFAPKKNGLNSRTPAVFSFLSRFDGNHGFQRFEPSNLQDITKYTYAQITSLLDEYRDEDFEMQQDTVFAGKDLKSNPKRLEASKNLWYSDKNAIINKDGCRVYYIPDQKESMKFGYYQNYCRGLFRGSNQWCVTGTGASDSRANLWATYRPSRTFYFIIDETKLNGKTIEEVNSNITSSSNEAYYLGAIQVVTDNNMGYRLTYMLNNDGDRDVTWEQLVQRYPQLDGEKEKFRYIKFEPNLELADTNIVTRINEVEGNPYEFSRQERRLKKAYITGASGNITKARSWQSMDEGLRELYVLSTEKEDVHEKFQTYELIDAIKKSGNIFKVLNQRLTQIGLNGVAVIYDKVLESQFNTARVSLDNKNIRLYRDRSSKKYGLYHGLYGDFLKFGGIKYEPFYEEIDTSVLMTNDGEAYVVETYSKSGAPDNTSFYCVFPADSEGKLINGHFLTHDSFLKLKERFEPGEDESFSMVDKISQDDFDIKEIEKGV